MEMWRLKRAKKVGMVSVPSLFPFIPYSFFMSSSFFPSTSSFDSDKQELEKRIKVEENYDTHA